MGDIKPGATYTVMMSFQVTGGGMPVSDYRHSVIRASQQMGMDIFYNRHPSLKISHWLDTLLVDYGFFIGAPPGPYQEPPPEYIYASDVSVFFDRDLDFGDAPDKPYRTLLANDGARHAMPSALYLGAVAPDAESDGAPGPLAQGDDMTGGDDEDGVALVGALVRGSNATFRVVASAGGLLNAWIDFNQNGSWADAADQIVADGALAAGTNVLGIAVPSGAALGDTFARFRFSSAVALLPFGLAADGEVEDYRFTVYQPAPIGGIAITNIVHAASNATVVIRWNGQSPIVYETQYVNALSTGMTWTTWGHAVPGPPYEQTNTVTSLTQRLYRVTAPYTAP